MRVLEVEQNHLKTDCEELIMNETRNINGQNLSKINHYKICESYTQDIC